MWSDTGGLFAGVRLRVTDIMFDRDEASQFYGKDVGPREVFAMGENSDAARNLRSALRG